MRAFASPSPSAIEIMNALAELKDLIAGIIGADIDEMTAAENLYRALREQFRGLLLVPDSDAAVINAQVSNLRARCETALSAAVERREAAISSARQTRLAFSVSEHLGAGIELAMAAGVDVMTLGQIGEERNNRLDLTADLTALGRSLLEQLSAALAHVGYACAPIIENRSKEKAWRRLRDKNAASDAYLFEEVLAATKAEGFRLRALRNEAVEAAQSLVRNLVLAIVLAGSDLVLSDGVRVLPIVMRS